MAEIEQILADLLKPYGFKIILNSHNIDFYTVFSNNNGATIHITGNQIKLHQPASQDEILVDLCDPDSLKIIEDWATL